MPFDVAGSDLFTSLKENCALLKTHLQNLENSRMYHL